MALRVVAYGVFSVPGFSGEVVLIVRGTGLTASVAARLAICGVGRAESVTLIVNALLPAAVGVPEIAPPLSFRPAGSVPALRLQV